MRGAPADLRIDACESDVEAMNESVEHRQSSGRGVGVMAAEYPRYGALVISLDFELLWGVRDRYPPGGGSYRQNLLGARIAIPRMLELFEEFGIHATWATVGMLFAASRDELQSYFPDLLPTYDDPRLSPYEETVGTDERNDPLHFAPSLIEAIQRTPGQEIGTHTFSHYYCLAPGQTRQMFRADLASAVAIAGGHGIQLRSIVLPRNQVNSQYSEVLVDAGLVCYRGNPAKWMYRENGNGTTMRYARRAGRLLDGYLGPGTASLAKWDQITQAACLYDIPASNFLRPFSPRLRHFDALRIHRITRGLMEAAKLGGIYHLWWHPHNFGTYLEENLALLRRVLQTFEWCRDVYGMRSLAMGEVSEVLVSE